MITEQTAVDIALAYREIAHGEKLLEEVKATRDRFQGTDIRDAFGRRADGLELGVPSGDNSKRLFQVKWSLAEPVIEAHIADKRSQLAALMIKAEAELASGGAA
jgi:hypothetical protein